MEHLNIPIFPGQGTTSDNVQDQAIVSSSSPTGTLLLSSCFEAFHSELSSLSDTEREMTGVNLADFDRPLSLLVPSNSYLRNPVISGTRLLLLQVLIYLEWATRNIGVASDALAAPLQRNCRYSAGIIGFSSGVISACVVGTSATLLDLLSNATSAFRVALWIGVRTQSYRRRALVASNDVRSWSRILLGIEHHAAEEAINQFVQRHGESSPLYVSAINDEQCITVSGHPDILDSFIATLPKMVSVRETSIGTMYHSPHNTCVREEVLEDLCRRKIHFPALSNIVCPIRSSFTGETLEANQNGSLVQLVIDMILIQPVNWVKVTNAVAYSIPKNETVHLVNVGPGTGLIRSMEKVVLCRGGSTIHHLVFDDAKKDTISEPGQDCIAIVGMAVNFPGAPTVPKLWDILEQGINTLAEVPVNRFRVSDYTTGRYGRSMRTHTGNFLEDVDKFDHEFFNISPREARSMDPQMRILLQTAYEALEDSGYVPNASLSFNPGTFGCYVGAATGDYVQNLRHNIDVYYSTGTLRAFLSGRISHAMGFGGPSMVVDTACSSSLVAIYQACRALLNGDCSAALAGGVNVITSPDMFLGLDRGHFLSPTGPCRVFDASADGYSRGEGCGLFVLKRLSDAQTENDRIIGVIRGVEVNQSGTARSITQPHIPTQVKLFRQLLEKSGVAPEDVNIVEAHGTGTQSGDVDELASVRHVFAANRSVENPLHITSIKANIGHLEAASGAAGLAKLLLMLQHRTIPRLISLINLNPRISGLDADHTLIDTENQQWNPTREGWPRMALLNNFGAAGSNCALLLQEFVLPDLSKESVPSTIPYIFGLSAKTEVALDRMRARLIDWLGSTDARDFPLSAIAYSLTARRQIYEHRISFTAHTRQDLAEGLLSGRSPVRVPNQDGKAAFVFSGQGGQYLGMGGELYRSVPLFRGIVDRCHAFLVKSGFPGVLQVIVPEMDSNGLSEAEQLEVYQSAIFALEYGLSQLWISWGVTPTLVAGHSLGEYVAQTVAGVLTLQDALLLIANRAHFMAQKCAPGSNGMMAVNLSAAAIGQILGSLKEFSDITIACYNSPEDHVVSGPVTALQALKSYLDKIVRCKSNLLPVEFGHHSDAMRPLHDDLTSLARRITISPPTIPIISNVYGMVVLPGDASVFDSQYYSRHCTQPVLFDDGIRAVAATHALPVMDVWIEIGPHATVLPTLRRNSAIQGRVLFLASMHSRQHPMASLYSALAQLYVSPFEIKWRNVFSHLGPLSNISLPTYPWSNSSFWVSFEEGTPPTYNIPSVPVSKAGSIDLPYTVLYTWVQTPSPGNGLMSVHETPIVHLATLIRGHCVRGQPLCPASVYQELALAGVESSFLFLHFSHHDSFIVLRDVEFSSPLIYSEDAHRGVTVQTSTVFETENVGSWKVVSISCGEKKTHARGGFQLQLASGIISKFNLVYAVVSSRVASIISKRDGKLFTTSSIYEVFFPRIVEYGESYRAIRTLTISADGTEGYATIQLPNDSTDCDNHSKFVVHPILMDAILHVAGFIANMRGSGDDAFICSKVGCVEVIPHLIDDSIPYGVYVNCAWLSGGDMLAESYALEQGQSNRIVAVFEGIRFRRVPLATLERVLAATGPAVPEFSRPQGGIMIASSESRSSLLPPFSPHVSKVHPVGMQSPSDTLLDSPSSPTVFENSLDSPYPDSLSHSLSPGGIKPDVVIVGGTSKAPHGGDSGVKFSSSPPVKRFQSRDDNASQPDVRALLATVLGLEERELHEDADLESLGLDSLASIEAHHVLQSHFSVFLPSDLFTTHPSAKAVQSFIAGLLPASSKSLNVDTNSCSGDTTRSDADRSAATTALNTIITHVQKIGLPDRTPLFLVHDGSGLINFMYSLPPLGRDLWGIHNPRFMDSRPWESVASMATEYAKYITKAAGPGPVLLGGWNAASSPRRLANVLNFAGWSFGGIIAFEAARQLLKSGIAVKGVVLIDSPSPLNHVPLSDTLIESVVKLDRNPAPSNIDRLVKRQFQMNSQLLLEYDPNVGGGPYPQVVLLRSCENYCPGGSLEIPDWLSNRDSNCSTGWETMAGVLVKCIEIPGHHFQSFHSPYVASTSSAIVEACAFLEETAER